MKLGFFAAVLGLAILLTAGGSSGAQNLGRKSTTRIIVEDGETLTVTGCLHRSPEGSLTLTHAAGKDGAVGSYLLAVTNDEDDLDDLEEHVGHRLEISGKAADRGAGRIKVRTRSEVKGADGRNAKTESKSEVKGDLAGLPYLGMKSFRMLATVCP
jgi:hypothetical protein